MQQRHRRAWAVVAVVLSSVVALAAALALPPRLDQVTEVDAVVVLGGGSGERLALGRALAESHDVPLVLTGDAVDVGSLVGLRCDAEVVCVEPEPWNTAGEARAAAALAEEQHWDRVAVATSHFHVNRARTLFDQCFGTDAVDVTGGAAPGSWPRDVYRYGRELFAHAAAVTIARAC